MDYEDLFVPLLKPPSRLPHQVTWQSPPAGKNAYGELTGGGTAIANGTAWPASVEEGGGRKYRRGDQEAAEIAYTVWCRFLAGLTAQCIGVWLNPPQGGTVTLQVLAALPLRGQARWMRVLCRQLESP
jgi:head-tail adaptor